MPDNFDVFLSHNSRDKPAVRELAQSLQKRGLRVWLDEWELVPGRPWQEALEEVIDQTRAAAVLVGSEGIGPWQQPEMRAVLSQFVSRGTPVIPVLLPQAPSRVDLPLFLENFTWVDFREGFSEENLNRLTWGITGTKPGVGPIVADEHQPAYRPSTVRPKLEDVFKTVGLPKFTYVEPSIYRKFAHTIRVPGKHIVLEGPSGVGKTSLVFRVFEEYGYTLDTDYLYVSARDDHSDSRIFSALHEAHSQKGPKFIVIDDVHMLSMATRRRLADQLKLLSDRIFTADSPPKAVLVGIPAASSALLAGAIDLGPRLATFKLGIATNKEIESLITEGEERLSVRFRDRDAIISESAGNFYLCQFICHAICFFENILESQDTVVILRSRLEDIHTEIIQELEDRYWQHVMRFSRGAAWKVENDLGYAALLASLARIPKSIVHVNEILVDAGPYGPAVMKAILSIGDMVRSDGNGSGLERLVHYDPSIEMFSFEDPTFRYYLNRLNVSDVLETLGLHNHSFVSHYDVDKIAEKPRGRERASERDPTRERDVVFVSYSHADSMWMERIRVHLAPMMRQGLLSMWSDAQIRAGGDWEAEIGRAIGSAKVAVLLVSANYLASDFIVRQELPPLLERAKNEGLKIVWVPIDYSLWDATPIADYQAAHDPHKPLSSLSKADTEMALVKISRAIISALDT